MMKKSTISYLIYTIALLYIITPWLFEKFFLFNELLAVIGALLLICKRRIGRDTISICVCMILLLAFTHAIVSLFRMDSIYYYFRNMVIMYSIFSFFIGWYLLKYLPGYIARVRVFLRPFIGIFLFIRLPRWLFERFGVSMVFPALFRRAAVKWVPWMLVTINIIYGFSYDSLTALLLASFYLFLFISPGYKFFKQTMVLGLLAFVVVFIYLVPYLSIISRHYNYHDTTGIHEVMNSNPLLKVDGNNTWRLVLWKEIIVDLFPRNIFGIGFGTPALRYFPIEELSKLRSLPYVLGSHNSFVYLFGRLGILYILFIIPVYVRIFKEYFRYKDYYYANNGILIFWSFFAVTVVSAFNPALESPIFAGAYWLILGLTARTIRERTVPDIITLPAIQKTPPYENLIHT